MTLTFLELYNECAGQPWSMFDNDAESNEDFESGMKISINKAISYLWNIQPWSFRISLDRISTKEGKNLYEVPEGILIKKTINGSTKYGIKCDGEYLNYLPNFELLDEEVGKPEGFYIEGDNLYLYPTPDKKYQIEMKYSLLNYGMSEDDDPISELKEDKDRINIPPKYEILFKNCVISKAMLYAIADESDENYSGYLAQYEEALDILLKYCKNGIIDKYIVW